MASLIHWDQEPQDIAADPAAAVAVDRARWEAAGAKFEDYHDEIGGVTSIATASLDAGATPIRLGVVDQGARSTFVLVMASSEQHAELTRQVLAALEKDGVLRGDEVLERLPASLPDDTGGAGGSASNIEDRGRVHRDHRPEHDDSPSRGDDDLSTLVAEPLCAHHSLAHFRSGDEEADTLARGLLDRIRAREARDFTAVVITDTSFEVSGILATTDIYLSAERETDFAGGKALFYYLLAMTQGPKRDRVLWMLLREVDSIRQLAHHDTEYVGEVAIPMRSGIMETDLTGFLEHQGFTPTGPGGLWFRPK